MCGATHHRYRHVADANTGGGEAGDTRANSASCQDRQLAPEEANRIVTGLAAFPVGRPGPTRCGPSQPPCSSNATQPTVVVRCVHRTTQGHKSRRWAEQSIVNPRLRRNNTFKQRIASRPVRPICPQDGTPGEACASAPSAR